MNVRNKNTEISLPCIWSSKYRFWNMFSFHIPLVLDCLFIDLIHYLLCLTDVRNNLSIPQMVTTEQTLTINDRHTSFKTGMTSLVTPITATNRSITSTYKKSDTSFFISEDTRKLELPATEKDGSDILVLHPGSRNIRIGLSRDALPRTILSAISKTSEPNSEPFTSCPTFNDVDIDALQEQVEQILDSRSSILKKKPLPNTTQQILNYNRHQKPSVIAGHNDAFNVEWTKISDENGPVFGQDALLIHPTANYRTIFPIRNRHLNYQSGSYHEQDSIHDDLSQLIRYICNKELGIDSQQLSNYAIVIILPDICHRWEIKSWLRILFGLGFKAVSILQESIAATFGAGLGSACVVDIGAEQSTIALVEDGSIIKRGQMILNYGSDHLLPLFYNFLKYYEFPYQELDPHNCMDIELLLELKERTCTLVESDLAIQVIDFYVRQPGEPTQAYQFKSFDERFHIPLALFNVNWLRLNLNSHLWYKSYGNYDNECMDLISNDDSVQISWPPEALFAREEEIYTEDITNDENDETSSIDIVPVKETKGKRKRAILPPVDEDNIIVADTSETDVINQENVQAGEQEICIKCQWNNCKIDNDMDLDTLMEHILSEHKDSVCHWNDCGSKIQENHFALESHIARHFSDIIHPLEVIEIEKKVVPNPVMIGIDEAIFNCITSTENDVERKRKWLCSILLVGGGHLFPGFQDLLAERLANLSSNFITQDDQVGSLKHVKDIDPKCMCWKGGCVYSRLETAREFWIPRTEWETIGIKSFLDKYAHLREG